jgi:hypothetical protein
MTLNPGQREVARRSLPEFFKRPDGSWRAEARAAFREFLPYLDGSRAAQAKLSERYAEALLSKLEDAAAHVGCSLEGIWKAGIHFIPGSALSHSMHAEGFLLRHVKGRYSPFIIEPGVVILQTGESAAAFRYDMGTDMRHIFEYALSPGSFF